MHYVDFKGWHNFYFRNSLGRKTLSSVPKHWFQKQELVWHKALDFLSIMAEVFMPGQQNISAFSFWVDLSVHCASTLEDKLSPILNWA